MGALGVVLETFFSGISELPLGGFLLLMQPIHLAIGVVEGLVTAAVVTFVWKARPEILATARRARTGTAACHQECSCRIPRYFSPYGGGALVVRFGQSGRTGVVDLRGFR